MKNKSILFAATAAAVVAAIAIIARSTHAAAPDTTAPAATGMTAVASTNSADEMAALFGDLVRGNVPTQLPLIDRAAGFGVDHGKILFADT